MAGRQAKTITPAQVNALMRHVRGHSDPDRSRAILLLSLKAGLRAAEIAQLEWPMVLGPTGDIAHVLAVDDRIAKKRAGRLVPMHADLRQALVALRRQAQDNRGPVIRSRRGGALRPNSLVNWFIALFQELGFEGCSSHSGRRTFITMAARMTHKAGGSLRDVQLLAGHASIETTQAYIDGDSFAQHRLIALL